jgi:radical SAM-linked protein
MRSLERLLRRAGLPFRMTEGFHPTPRLVLAQSLPLGVVGHAEVLELELTEEIQPAEILARLQPQSPPGIEFISAKRIPLKTTARPRRAFYRITLDSVAADLPDQVVNFLSSSECWVERDRPKPRAINIRPYVESLTIDNDALLISAWLTQEGSARADEIASSVGVEQPSLIERTGLELLDEVSPEEAAQTPRIEPQGRPLNRVVMPGPRPAAPRETWGATANGPVVE